MKTTSLFTQIAVVAFLYFPFGILNSALAAEGDTIRWIASSSDHNWHEPTNWDLGRVPEDGDMVVMTTPSGSYYTQITTTVTNTVPATGKFKKLTVNGQHTLSVKGWNSKIMADEIVLNSGVVYHSKISCPSCSSTSSNRVWIVADTITVNSNTSITASGYEPWIGPCWEGVASPFGSPAHGGLASSGNAKICGSITEPELPGGGGGTSSGLKAIGGGAIRIEATTLKVNGTISATGGQCPYNQNGAAGGSVYIICTTISGSGTVEANGGGNADTTMGQCGGAGRIAVHYNAEAQKDVTCGIHFSARGGYDGLSGTNASDRRFTIFSQCGTLYFTDDQFIKRNGIHLSGKIYYGPAVTRFGVIETAGDFEIANCLPDLGGDGAHVSIGGNLTLRGSNGRKFGLWTTGSAVPVTIGGNLNLNGAMLRIQDGGDLTVGGNIIHENSSTAQASGELYVKAAPTNGLDGAVCGTRVAVTGDWTVGRYGMVTTVCNPTNGAAVLMTANNFTLENDALLSANSGGWGAGKGPGASGGLTGSAYGGRGCLFGGGLTGSQYGNKKLPLQPGSGSNSRAGGGLVWLETLHRMTLNGKISANGANSDNYIGATSGGSVYLHCGSCLSGTNGTITANGGNGGGLGGSGGGGRIAVYHGAKAGNCAITAQAQGGRYSDDTNKWGEDGTVYWGLVGGTVIMLR